ncbi:MAG: alpha/beta fold hydrolase, partial [Bacteroidota bacterium]
RRLPESVTCPALVVHGHDDPIVPLWAGEELARRLRARLEVVRECGHFAPEEYPSPVLAMIQKFLDECAPTP